MHIKRGIRLLCASYRLLIHYFGINKTLPHGSKFMTGGDYLIN